MISAIKQKMLLITTITLMALMMTILPAQASEFNIDELASQYAVWIGLFFIVVEYILGKTTLVKSGSTLELVINAVIGLLKKIVGSKSSLKSLK